MPRTCNTRRPKTPYAPKYRTGHNPHHSNRIRPAPNHNRARPQAQVLPIGPQKSVGKSRLSREETRLDTLADRITGLHVSQEEAVEATDIAAKAAFGETGGIVNVPDGTKVVLPADLAYGRAMVVHPDGSVTVFVGDLHKFLPYIGR